MGVDVLIKEKIIYLFILMILGYLAARIKFVNEDVSKGLSKVILTITFPLLIFTTFITKELSISILLNCLYVLLFAYFSLFLLFLTGFLSSKVLKLKGSTKIIHILHTTHGNIAFLGFPIIGSIFGNEGLLYASIFILANDSILWSISVFLMNGHDRSDLRKALTHLVNPNTIALICGLICMLLQVKIPRIILAPAQDLGHSTIVLSMLYIGAMLSFIKISNLFTKFSIWVVSFNKLILIPIIVLFISYFLTFVLHFSINKVALSVVIMEVAMPAMTTIAILAKEYNSDYIQATENVFVTTLLSLFTIPFIVYLIHLYIN